MKCSECENLANTTARWHSPSYPLCDVCIEKGWGEATPEDFIKDPNFTIGYVSPIQLHDL